MTLIDSSVKKLFGHKQQKPSIDSPEFTKHCIENAPDTVGKYYEYTSDTAIKDFLFEQTDIAKLLKKYTSEIKESHGNPEEENT